MKFRPVVPNHFWAIFLIKYLIDHFAMLVSHEQQVRTVLHKSQRVFYQGFMELCVHSQAQIFLGPKFLIFCEQQHFVWDTAASPSKKWLDMLKILEGPTGPPWLRLCLCGPIEILGWPTSLRIASSCGRPYSTLCKRPCCNWQLSQKLESSVHCEKNRWARND